MNRKVLIEFLCFVGKSVMGKKKDREKENQFLREVVKSQRRSERANRDKSPRQDRSPPSVPPKVASGASRDVSKTPPPLPPKPPKPHHSGSAPPPLPAGRIGSPGHDVVVRPASGSTAVGTLKQVDQEVMSSGSRSDTAAAPETPWAGVAVVDRSWMGREEKTEFDIVLNSVLGWLADERKGKELFALLTRFAGSEEERQEWEKIFRYGLVEILKMGLEGLYNISDAKADRKIWGAAGKVGSVSVLNLVKYVNLCMVESKKRGAWTKQFRLNERDIADFTEAVRWVDYAANAYSQDRLVGQVLVQNRTNRLNMPVFLLASLPPPEGGDFEELVLTVRGTEQMGDIFTNVNAEIFPIPEFTDARGFSHCYAHRGMYRCADAIYARVEGTLRSIAEHNQRQWLERHAPVDGDAEPPRPPATRLIITGHSLGAAVAAILTILVRMRMEGEFRLSLRCFAYAPAACISGKEALEICDMHVRSFILGDDIVPRLTVQAATQLVRILTSDVFLATYGPAFMSKVASTFGIQGGLGGFLLNCAKDLWMDGAAYDKMMAKKMVPPGRLHHLMHYDRKMTKVLKKEIEALKKESDSIENDFWVEERVLRKQIREQLAQKGTSAPDGDSGAEASEGWFAGLRARRAQRREERQKAKDRLNAMKARVAYNKRLEKREREGCTLVKGTSPKEFDLLSLTPSCISHHFLEEYIDAIDCFVRDVFPEEAFRHAMSLHTRDLRETELAGVQAKAVADGEDSMIDSDSESASSEGDEGEDSDPPPFMDE